MSHRQENINNCYSLDTDLFFREKWVLIFFLVNVYLISAGLIISKGAFRKNRKKGVSSVMLYNN